MIREQFISEIAKYVQKYAPTYGIEVCSPIIGQAILESGCGTSFKAKYHNYFGLKYRTNRCSTACGIFKDDGTEQKLDGTYVPIIDDWFAFPSMEDGVIGYFDFTNTSSYNNLKGVTDPKTYLQNLKKDKYATDKNYVQKVLDIIEYNHLTRFDVKGEKIMSTFNIHAGHNPDGKIACGAISLIKESTEARIVKNEVIRQLTLMGHTCYDCTVDDGKNQGDVLSKIVHKCNSHKVDLDVSIHFNSGANNTAGNGVTTGTECFIFSNDSKKAKRYAENITANLSALGFKNRGVKVNPNLYVLRNTNAEALLIEVCFVDDADDVMKYNAFMVASAIVTALSDGQVVPVQTVQTDPEAEKPTAETPVGNSDTIYRVQVGAFKNRANAEKLKIELAEMGVKGFITQ